MLMVEDGENRETQEKVTPPDRLKWLRVHGWRILVGLGLLAGSIPVAQAAYRNYCEELVLKERSYYDVSCRIPGGLMISYTNGLVPDPEAPYATDISLLKPLDDNSQAVIAKVGIIRKKDGGFSQFYYWPRPPVELITR